ncbi:hypothetical protein ARSEF1564_010293, partial [Beauveria bassiana]
MNCLDMIFEVVQAGQEVTKMLASGVAAHKLRIAFF